MFQIFKRLQDISIKFFIVEFIRSKNKPCKAKSLEILSVISIKPKKQPLT